ncbi:MAG: hypothetical protein ACYTDT_14375, partial [Planctomycetota bacterium]
MTNEDPAMRVAIALTEAEMPYLLAGSYSSNFYGIPRATQDAVFVVQVLDARLTPETLNLAGDLLIDGQLTFETVTGTLRIIGQFEATGFKVEFFELSKDPHDQERFARRVRVQYGESAVFLPTAEDVVVWKLRWSASANRPKDRADIQAVIGVQGDALDWDYINKWADEHGT